MKTVFQGKVFLGFVSIASLIVIWLILTETGLIKPLFLPSPLPLFGTFIDLLRDGYGEISLFHHIALSLMRVLLAFLLACLIGIPLGLLMAMSRIADGIFDPLIELYRPVPPIALIPLFIIWLGIGEMSKIGIIFISIFAVIVLNTISGVKSIVHTKIWAAQSLGADRMKLFRHIILPGALPGIMTGMRVGIGFGWTTLVAAEMIAAASGIGWMALNARRFLRTDIILCGVILMGIIGLLLDRLLRIIEKKLVPWKGKE
jgi:taurine transport system permease protein